jgi:hypothetical protein
MELTKETNINVWEKNTWYITKDHSCLMVYKKHTEHRIHCKLVGPGIGSNLNIKSHSNKWGFVLPWKKATNEEILQKITKAFNKFLETHSHIYCFQDRSKYDTSIFKKSFKIIKDELFENNEIWVKSGKNVILWHDFNYNDYE